MDTPDLALDLPDALRGDLLDEPTDERLAEADARIRVLEARARHAEALAALALDALRAPDPCVTIGHAARVVNETLATPIVRVLEQLADGTALTRAAVGTEATLREDDRCLAAYAVRAGEPVVAPDLSRETRFRPAPAVIDAGAVSGVAVPIAGPEGAWGALVAHDRVPRAFRDDEVAYLVAVADVIGGAVARHRREVALAGEASLLAVTLRSIGDAVVATDTEGRVTLLNEAAERLLGWPLDEARGLAAGQVVRLYSPGSRDPAEDPVRSVLRTGRTLAGRPKVLRGRAGGERVVSDVTAPLRTSAGAVLGAALVLRDVNWVREPSSRPSPRARPNGDASDDPFAPGDGSPRPWDEVARTPSGARRVLFMDDEPYLRRVIGDGLREFGYEVTLAEDGEEAIAQHTRAR
ncbi:MAG: PAS domain-containing protein, partial [Myxococcota bacterium]